MKTDCDEIDREAHFGKEEMTRKEREIEGFIYAYAYICLDGHEKIERTNIELDR